jgi:uncharacterized Zn finger protein
VAFFAWKPYVPVAKRRQQAAACVKKLAKKGLAVEPVIVEGRTIARTFWGKSWCENLERYSDYESRLPRGRTYVRNGSVVDLKIARGEIAAMVSGSEVYTVRIAIEPASPPVWKTLCEDCAGSIDSLVELLQGRFSKGVMERVCLPGKGLFPAPKEIKLACSCPDWADMCKHVAAVLYGVGARLDASPELLFILRGVDQAELVAKAGEGLAAAKKPIASKRMMAGGDLSALFGVEMAETGGRADASLKAHVKGQGKGKARAKTPAKTALAVPASSRNSRATSAKSPPADSAPAGAVRMAPNAARKIRGRSPPMAKGAARVPTKPVAAAAKTSEVAIKGEAPRNTAVHRSAVKRRHAIGKS